MRVVVAVEDDPLVLFDDFWQQLGDGFFKRLAAFHRLLQLGRHVVQRLGDGHVERDVRIGDALPRRYCAELELVARERERAGPVSVAGIARQLRQHHHTGVELAAALS